MSVPTPPTGDSEFQPADDDNLITGALISDDELRLVEALRRGDEAAFATLLECYHLSLVRLARLYVSSQAVAEEVAQETWLGVLQGLERFEGRSSLKTWIFRILTNRAKTRGQREARSVPFSDLTDPDLGPDEPAVDPSHFISPDDPVDGEWAGHWNHHVDNWANLPESALLSQETLAHIEAAIAKLPPHQREVMTLRDIEGWSTPEICAVLGLSEANQRVLLHRARSKVRQILEKYLAESFN